MPDSDERGRYRAQCQDCDWVSPVTSWDKEAESDARGHESTTNHHVQVGPIKRRTKDELALQQLKKAQTRAERAEDVAADGGKVESDANNTRRWAEKSVEVAEHSLHTESGQSEESE